MNELISEVENIIDVYRKAIERNKKYREYAFTNDCDNYYSLILLHKTLEVWERCLQLLEKYSEKRCIPNIDPFKGEMFGKVLMEGYKYSRQPSQKMLLEMIEYIKTLEWKLQEKTSLGYLEKSVFD